MPTSPPSLKGRALRLLAAREHSRAELERKLRRHEVEPGQLTQLLAELQAKGFIDERRVIESVVHRRAAALGVARIRQELQAKGLGADTTRAALAGLQQSELERARALWRKKFGVVPDRPAGSSTPTPASAMQARARQARFLAARGFDGATIRRVVGGADAWSDDDPATCG